MQKFTSKGIASKSVFYYQPQNNDAPYSTPEEKSFCASYEGMCGKRAIYDPCIISLSLNGGE